MSDDAFDNACEVLADFADIKSPWTLSHSKRVSALAETSATRAGDDPTLLRRAGLLHDVGRVGISAGIWGKRGPLSESQREKVRLHAYNTDRILARSAALLPIARVASSAHERCDGGGYFRGLHGGQLEHAARLLGAADVYCALAESRPHRAARSTDEAVMVLRDEARAGLLDADAVEMVLQDAGHAAMRLSASRPAGLSEREAEVLAHLARGATNKEIARRLGISPKTVDNQVQSIYAKAGVRTRAGATLFAMERGFVT